MSEAPNRIQLIGYLEEALDPAEMTRIEERLRESSAWRQSLLELLDEVDPGDHSVATIWRRHHLTCPSRERLGAYAMGALPPEAMDYLQFHVDVIRCRWCLANLSDIAASTGLAEPHDPETTRRRRRIFESSVGHLSVHANRVRSRR